MEKLPIIVHPWMEEKLAAVRCIGSGWVTQADKLQPSNANCLRFLAT